MKIKLLLLLSLISSYCYSQVLNDKDLKKIKSFGIVQTDFNLNDKRVNNDWNLILEKDKKRKTNKTVGFILTSLSILSTTFGAKLISENKNSEEGLGQSIGTMFVVGGIINAGISIPLFIYSGKRKKERNKLIELYSE